jgi:putative transposase
MAHDVRVGRKRVERLMREAGISPMRCKRGRTTISVPGVRVADDLVERQFHATAPNVLWVADVTYLRTWEGWLYLAAVQDAYSRRIVGWGMAEHMRAKLVDDALEMAVARRRPQPGLIHHSDQGSIRVARVRPGRPRRRHRPLDGQPRRLRRQRRRRELLRHAQEGTRAPPLLATRRQLTSELFDHIEAFYSRVRRHSTLGMLSPLEFENTTRRNEDLASPYAARTHTTIINING